MDYIVINGGKPLVGEVEMSGTKNAAVAIILGCLLIQDKVIIENIPDISDVSLCFEILRTMGAEIRMLNKSTFEIDTTRAVGGISPLELVRKMRASYYLIGTELVRFGRAYVGYPGGCNFGVRPIDQHMKGFEAMGATVQVEGGYIEATAPPEGLKSSTIYMDRITVGATINIMLAATLTRGTTIIENAAREPHVVDLANFLNSCGAHISGAGTGIIKIRGVEKLHGTRYAIIPDMIEAGTFMIAAAATGGHLRINNVIPKHLESITAKLEEMGVDVTELDDAIIIKAAQKLQKVNVHTLEYPGFPTDMGPQMCVLMCMTENTSTLREGVWDNRFKYVEELRRMGASINVDGRIAIIEGKTKFSGAVVKAVDLRAGVAMIIAGLAATGTTQIEDIEYIERGYENIVQKLSNVGADIRTVKAPANRTAKPLIG